ncbi:MAG: macrolide ABC transporter ATP-binding protein [Elusimicrobia bacterium RBG_16_66_12]|nr:MAG: macrolide ABC transporter ATP-binding protein [Elusimicrobia bacterium RBG_16_66_12]
MLRLSDVRKKIGEGEAALEIVRGVSITIQQGEFVAIMGSSGSGKSTLLNMIGLLDRPTSGSITLMGRDVSSLGDDEMSELRCRAVGFIFQNFHLLPYLTAMQNVCLPMDYARKAGAAERAVELLGKVGLAHRANSYPATMSGGERQRVAIARALANDPVFLLADEPTGALDSRTGAQIMNLLAELHHGGSTILLITHDEKVGRRAEKTLVISDGRLV